MTPNRLPTGPDKPLWHLSICMHLRALPSSRPPCVTNYAQLRRSCRLASLSVFIGASSGNRTRITSLPRRCPDRLNDRGMELPAGVEPATTSFVGRRSLQLSYGSILVYMAPSAGLEPATSGFVVRRSIQLSYEGKLSVTDLRSTRKGSCLTALCKWCPLEESNLRIRLTRAAFCHLTKGAWRRGRDSNPQSPALQAGAVTNLATSSWSFRQDSNLRHMASKAVALSS